MATLLTPVVFAESSSPPSASKNPNRGLVVKEQQMERRAEQKASAAANREAVRARFEAIRDERKLALLENIEERLANLNARRTEQFLNMLTRIETILGKIIARTDTAETEGRDVTEIRSALQSVQDAIDSSRALVEAQAAKVYEVADTDEAGAGFAAQAAMTELRSDLEVVQQSVKTARDKLKDVFILIKELVGEDSPESSPAM